MNNKYVLLFSTRHINEKGGVFENAKLMDQMDSALCDFFLAKYKSILETLKKNNYNDSEIKSPIEPKNIFEEICDFVKDNFHLFGKYKEVRDQLHNNDESLVLTLSSLLESGSINNENLKELINQWHKAKNETTSSFLFDSNDFELFKDYQEKEILGPYNVNNGEELTLRHRVSLYQIGSNEGDYGIYAVWPLIHPDDDKNEGGSLKSKWVEALTEAVKNVNKNVEKILLILHDKDLESTKNFDFRTIYSEKKDTDSSPVRSLVVYQHPDKEFRELTRSKDVKSAQDLFNKAVLLIKDNRIYQDLSDISCLLSKWHFLDIDKHVKEIDERFKSLKNDSVKNEIEEKLKFKIDNSRKSLCAVLYYDLQNLLGEEWNSGVDWWRIRRGMERLLVCTIDKWETLWVYWLNYQINIQWSRFI